MLNWIKEDIKTVKAIIKGEAKCKVDWKYIKSNFKIIIKENKMFFFIVALAFVCGYYVASKKYSAECTILLNQALENCTVFSKFWI